MDSDEYKKLLEQDEWKRKSETILNRDNFVCQECGCMGIRNNIPLKLIVLMMLINYSRIN